MSGLDQSRARRPTVTPLERAEGQCFLLISSPSDRVVEGCFRALGTQWRHCLNREQFVLEGEILLAPDFAEPIIPAAIQRVLAAECSLISKIEIELGGLTIQFVRSGGHAPFIESFFDEVHLEAERLQLSEAELQDILLQITQSLQVANVRGSSPLTALMDQPS